MEPELTILPQPGFRRAAGPGGKLKAHSKSRLNRPDRLALFMCSGGQPVDTDGYPPFDIDAVLAATAARVADSDVRVMHGVETLGDMQRTIEESLTRVDRSRRILDDGASSSGSLPFEWWRPGNLPNDVAVQPSNGGEPRPRSARVGEAV